MKTKKRKFKKIHQCIELKVIKQDLSDEQSVDMVAMTVMDLLEDRLSSELLELLKEMLLGFSPDMQLEIADDLLDFTCGRVIHTTRCMSADAVLKACYSWIADEKGFELA